MDCGGSPREDGPVSPLPQPNPQAPTPSSLGQPRPTPSPQQQQQHARQSPLEAASQMVADDTAVSEELDMFDMVLRNEYVRRSSNGAHTGLPTSSARHPGSRQPSFLAGGGGGSRSAGGVVTPPVAPAHGGGGTQLASLATSMDAVGTGSDSNAVPTCGPSSSPTLAFLSSSALGGDEERRRLLRKTANTLRQELHLPLPTTPPLGEADYDADLRFLQYVFMEFSTPTRQWVGGGGGGVRRGPPVGMPYPVNPHTGGDHAGLVGGSGGRPGVTAAQQQQQGRQQPSPSAGGYGSSMGAARSASKRRPSPNGLTAGMRKSERDAYNNGRSTIETEVSESLGCRNRGQPYPGIAPAFNDWEQLRTHNVNPCAQPARLQQQQQQQQQGHGTPRHASAVARRPQKGIVPATAGGTPEAAVVVGPARGGGGGGGAPNVFNPVVVKPTPGASGKGVGRSRGPRSESGKNIAPSNHSAFSECSGGETRSFQSTKTNLQNNMSSSAIATTNTSVSSAVYHNNGGTLFNSVAGVNGSAAVLGSEGVSL